ncbi:MAG: DUF2341 domain-containing protein [Myxococcales bacterium]
MLKRACVLGLALVFLDACSQPTVVCADGTTGCGGECRKLSGDPLNCGACGTVCAAGQRCVDSVCACPAATPNACGTGEAAFCTSFKADPTNCGECGKACAAGQLCSNAQCVQGCPATQTACPPNAPTFCASTKTDSANCGGCGKVCAAGQVCSDGECVQTCSASQTACPAAAPTYCADTKTDAANCGECGAACPAGQQCLEGECTCPEATPDACGAGAAAFCTRLSTDVLNCGTCGKTCDPGQLCSNGTCVPACTSAQTACPASAPTYCANTKTDAANCGACGQACPSGQQCLGGSCQCPAAKPDLCGTGASAFCTDLLTDPNHCGGCGHVCTTNTSCSAGLCGRWCLAAPVTVTSTLELAGYPVRLVVPWLEGMQPDFADLRFVDGASQQLAYWIESFTPGAQATVWVRPNALGIGDTSLTLFFGQDRAQAPTLNGDEVFTFFDDFSGTAMDTTKWLPGGEQVLVLGGQVTIGQANQPYFTPRPSHALTRRTFGDDVTLEARAWFTAGTSTTLGFGTAAVIQNGTSFVAGTAQTTLTAAGAWHRFTLQRMGSGQVELKLDGASVASGTNVVGDDPIKVEAYESPVLLDFLTVRPYVASEPSAVIGSATPAVCPCELRAPGQRRRRVLPAHLRDGGARLRPRRLQRRLGHGDLCLHRRLHRRPVRCLSGRAAGQRSQRDLRAGLRHRGPDLQRAHGVQRRPGDRRVPPAVPVRGPQGGQPLGSRRRVHALCPRVGVDALAGVVQGHGDDAGRIPDAAEDGSRLQ